MFVPCPHCGFLVALIVSSGGVPQRCPRCAELLDIETGKSPAAAPAAQIVPQPPPAAAKEPVEVAPTEIRLDKARDTTPEVRRGNDPSARARPQSPPRHPSFLRTISAPVRSDGSRWPGIVAAAVLVMLLVLQLLLAQRVELAATQRWRPVISSLCTVLRCDVPLWHQPSAYTMLARDVQAATSRAGVLQVKASFRNDAQWPQAWPALQLQLTDVNGQAVAARVLQPSDYHPGESPPPLAPGQSASVEFQVAEPATPIVAFNFEFR